MSAPKGKGLKMKFKVAEGPLKPQEVNTDTISVASVPFAGPKVEMGMFKKKETAVQAQAPVQAQLPIQKEQTPEQVPEQTPEQVPEQTQPPEQAPEQPQASEPIQKEQAPEQEQAPEKKKLVFKRTIPAITAPPPELLELQGSIDSKEEENPYEEKDTKPFAPADRKGFIKFIESRYKSFVLPRPLTKKINPNACSQMVLQTYKYQAFIREYMREASPYRGVLVYHGLGSGKTCTSIAASEALYGTGKKIIIMTPIALKENFLNELMFCGFRHFHLMNKWVSFPLTPIVSMFAMSDVGLPESYIKRLQKGDPSKRLLWVPDLSAPESESNFQDLESWKQAMIRQQIYEMLQNKFTFIGYTGSSKRFLKDIVMNKPTFFDDSVVIIDEIHNLTRLMAGKIDKYLLPPKKALTAFQEKDSAYEPVTVDNWVPKFPDDPEKYSRAILFYRLLIQAKNSKIIALSGTPIVNTPLELGILSNILHGYFHAVNETMTGDETAMANAKKILENHPRINYISIKKKDTGGIDIFFTKLDDGYIKQFSDEGVLEGLIYDEDSNETIEQIYADVSKRFTEANITLGNNPSYSALPLLPPTYEDFNEKFVDTESLSLRNPITFKKRISGLISYYRGSKEELMPSVSRDEVVLCPFSPHAFKEYATARLKELAESPPAKASYDEAEKVAEKESTSYRFRSRALCNFAFPPDLERPFPGTKKEEEAEAGITKDIYGDGVVLEGIQEGEEQPDDDDAPPAVPTPKTQTRIVPYQERLATVLKKLRDASPNIFKMTGTQDELLSNYSAKYAAIYERILQSKGSNLVYSQFKTVEGIGVLSIALEANGFAPIRLDGPEENLRLSQETIESLTNNPEQPRYILYSGGESIRVRQTLINIFNMFIDKLPSEIKSVLTSLPISNTKNMNGEICKVFMITGAGAEGLSLKCVRTVHIMEPYWNTVRTEQVKGRAIRICSHADLPFDERNVEIFTYISTISKELLKTQQTLDIQDEGKTTDQYILNLAEIKEKVNSSFLTAMKSSAVDCFLNTVDNENIACYAQEGSIDDFLYDPRIKEDIDSTDQTEIETVIERKGYKIKGVEYVGIKQGEKTVIYSTTNDKMKEPLGEIVGKAVGWFPGKKPI